MTVTKTKESSSSRAGAEPIPARECKHCHLPFQPTPQRPDFCCSGCQFVYGLINESGLDKYYDLQDGNGQPVPSLVFQPRDYAWLEDLVKEAEKGKTTASLVLDLQGISCIGCVWLIEQVFEQWPGGLAVQINSALGQIRISWTAGQCDVSGFARRIQEFGYLLAPPVKKENRESRLLVRRMGITAALAMNCMLFTVPFYFGMDPGDEYAPLFSLVTFLLATASLLYGGSYFIKRSWQSLRRGIVHIDLPISIGVVAAYAGSTYAWLHQDHSFIYFDFVTVFIFLMLVGRWTQQLAIEKNRNYLLGLQNQRQQVRLVIPGHREEDRNRKLPVTEISRGMRYALTPGQFVPVASELLSPSASFGMEWINGESEARHCRRSHGVAAGSIHLGSEEIELEAREDWRDSLLSTLLAMDIREAPRHSLLERIIKIYLLAVLAIAAAGFMGWFLASGNTLTALQVMISVLVVSCPCAIGVAWPLADEMAVARLRKKGVFVRDQSLWHRLAQVKKLIFDKTGTLTLENLALANPAEMDLLTSRQRRILLTMVRHTLHPVSRCLREYLLAEGYRAIQEEEESVSVSETVGSGLEAVTSEGKWRLGRPDWHEETAGKSHGHSDCQFTLNGKTLAEFRFAEEVRADARLEISRWLRQGFGIFILSGDRRRKVALMANLLGLEPDHCLGELSPADKADWVKEHDRRDTLMIGDGANDSLAFDSTWCRGTPAVDRGLLEQKADFYFLGRGLGGIRHLFETAEDRRKTLSRVFAFTIAYNLGAVGLCLAGWMNPLLAAVVMPLSSIISISSVMAQSRWREQNRARRAVDGGMAFFPPLENGKTAQSG